MNSFNKRRVQKHIMKAQDGEPGSITVLMEEYMFLVSNLCADYLNSLKEDKAERIFSLDTLIQAGKIGLIKGVYRIPDEQVDGATEHLQGSIKDELDLHIKAQIEFFKGY